MPSIAPRPQRWPLLMLALSLLAFAAAAGHAIALPGLDYDELLFVNAATGGESPSFIYRRLFGVPVLLMNYIGALKAYLFAPIFALLGVSAATIRWPAIVISLGSIALTYALARLTLRPAAAATAAGLLALDPVFVLLTKVDYGPIVLMMLLKLIAVYCLYRSLATGSPSLLWGTAAACMLGLFDKLNFIWFVLALVLTTLLLFRHELAVMHRRRAARLLAPVGTLLIVVLAVGLRQIAPLFMSTQEASRGITARFPAMVAAYAQAMDGRALYQWIDRGLPPSPHAGQLRDPRGPLGARPGVVATRPGSPVGSPTGAGRPARHGIRPALRADRRPDRHHRARGRAAPHDDAVSVPPAAPERRAGRARRRQLTARSGGCRAASRGARPVRYSGHSRVRERLPGGGTTTAALEPGHLPAVRLPEPGAGRPDQLRGLGHAQPGLRAGHRPDPAGLPRSVGDLSPAALAAADRRASSPATSPPIGYSSSCIRAAVTAGSAPRTGSSSGPIRWVWCSSRSAPSATAAAG